MWWGRENPSTPCFPFWHFLAGVGPKGRPRYRARLGVRDDARPACVGGMGALLVILRPM